MHRLLIAVPCTRIDARIDGVVAGPLLFPLLLAVVALNATVVSRSWATDGCRRPARPQPIHPTAEVVDEK